MRDGGNFERSGFCDGGYDKSWVKL